jgi:hypothetical protein
LSFLQLTFSIVTFSGQISQIREAKMSLGISSRLKHPKKHELIKSHSQAQILANKLRQDGVLTTVENVLQAVDQVAALLASSLTDPNISYKDSIINLCQHLKVRRCRVATP